MSRVRAAESQGATFVELFFDLVFVYAVTQLTATVLHDLTWAGVGRAALLFWLVWWAWTQFTWTLNLADTENTWVRLLTLTATAIAFFLAQSIPDAFSDAGSWFAISYVVIRLIGLGAHGWVLAGDEEQISSWAGFASASTVGLALVLVGGFIAPELRSWFWLAAIVADLVTAGIAGRGVWALDPGHFTERHGLIVIIALGESLIVAGVATSGLERDLVFALTAAGAVVATCALWWTYFGSLHGRIEARMEDEDRYHRGSFARDVYSFWHAAVIAGVIGIAVGFEVAISHPNELLDTGPAAALTVGTALFLGGVGAAARRAGIPDAAWPRWVGCGLALAATPAVSRIAPPAVMWGLGVLALALALYEAGSPRLLSSRDSWARRF